MILLSISPLQSSILKSNASATEQEFVCLAHYTCHNAFHLRGLGKQGANELMNFTLKLILSRSKAVMCRMWAVPNSIFSMWEEASALSGAAALWGFLSASFPGVSLALGSSEEKRRLSSYSKEKLSYFS